MSGRVAVQMLNSIERAKKQRYNARLLRAFKRARYQKSQQFQESDRGTPQNIALYGSDYAAATQPQRVNRLLSGYRGKGMYMGRGSYAASNALMDIGADVSGASTVPVVSSTGSADGGVVVRHKEYVSDVYAQGLGFENGHFVVNPGLERTFPWLAQVAANFTEYTLHQCVFTYKSAIAPIGASSTGQVGSIIMAAQYNVSDEPFSTKQQMLLESGACADMLTRDMVFGVECDPAKLSGAVGKYVRSGPVITQADAKTYDHAVLNIATDSLPIGYLNQNVGELWVEYTVELRKPRLFTGAGDAISRDVWAQSAPAGGTPPPGVSANANTWYRPFIGTASMLRAQQSSIGTLMQNTTNTVLFPAGYAGNVIMKVSLTAGVGAWDYPTGWINFPTGFTFAQTGNVVLIDDIPIAEGFASSVQNVQFNYAADTPISCTFEVHLRVDLASNGIDNTFTFVTPFQNGGVTLCPSACVCASAILDIQEYNASLNYKQNGSNDAIVFVDNLTNQVVNWTG